MPRSISWIDPSEVSRLALAASREVPPPATILLSAPVPRPDSVLPATPRFASVAPPPPAPAPFEARGDSIDARVTHLMDWLEELAGVDQLFVADSGGLAVAIRGVSPEHVATSAVLMSTLQEVRKNISSERRMAITMGPEAVLHVVALDTDWGAFGVGLVAADLLPDALLAKAQSALAATLGEIETGE